MAGPLLSLYIYFKEDSNPNEVLTFLLKEVFKNYFIPQSVYFQYEENGTYQKHDFGVDKSLLKKELLLSEEKELESIRLTKLNFPSCEDSILGILSKKTIWYYGFSAHGSLRNYYQQNSDIMEDYFFRERINNIYIPIIEICAHNEDLRKYKRKKLSEHSLSFYFINSQVLLDERDGINNNIAAEKNLENLIDRIKKLIDKFKDVYDCSYCNSYGLGYSSKLDEISNKFSILPNFKGVNWG